MSEEEREMRLRCIKQANRLMVGGDSVDQLVEVAERIYAFVTAKDLTPDVKTAA